MAEIPNEFLDRLLTAAFAAQSAVPQSAVNEAPQVAGNGRRPAMTTVDRVERPMTELERVERVVACLRDEMQYEHTTLRPHYRNLPVLMGLVTAALYDGREYDEPNRFTQAELAAMVPQALKDAVIAQDRAQRAEVAEAMADARVAAQAQAPRRRLEMPNAQVYIPGPVPPDPVTSDF